MSREITILTPENVELRFELAGLGSRFLALFTDTFWQLVATVVLILVVLGVAYAVGSSNLAYYVEGLSPWILAVIILILFSLWSGYFLFFEAARNGQTPGKRVVGIRVIRDTGHPLDFRSAVLRNLMRTVDALPGMYGVGIVSIFVSPQYRRVGDYVAGTLVVKVRKAEWSANARPGGSARDTAVPEAIAHPAPESHLPDELLVNLQLVTRDDYRAIRHFLDRRRELQGNVAASLAAKLAQPLIEKLNADPESMRDPLALLEAVAAEWERRMVH